MTPVHAIAKLGIICCNTDLLNADHVKLFHDAKLQCDRLIVVFQASSSSIISDPDRQAMLESIRWVDEVRTFSSDEDLIAMISAVRPDVRFVDEKLQSTPFPGFELPIRVVFVSSVADSKAQALKASITKSLLEKNMHADLAPYIDSVRQLLEKSSS